MNTTPLPAKKTVRPSMPSSKLLGRTTSRTRGSSKLIQSAKKLKLREHNQIVQRRIKLLNQRHISHEKIEPIRLQKVLTASGIGSRRDMDERIARGVVTVNGQVAQLGQRISPSDHVSIHGKPIKLQWPDRLPRIIIYHKPEGEIVSHHDPAGRISVFDRLPQARSSRWMSIGRLDLNSSGLLVLTTHGELANYFAHPRFEVEREYAVRLLGHLTDEQKKLLCAGIELKTGLAHASSVDETENNETASNQWYRITLKEGKNREVRELFACLGLTVSRLIRIRFGPITLPSRLKRGQFYELNAMEVANIMKWAKLALPGEKKNQSKLNLSPRAKKTHL